MMMMVMMMMTTIMMTMQWSRHSETLEAREEASVAVVDTKMFYLGGVGLSTVETIDLSGEKSWSSGPQLPLVMSRSCAVSTGETIIITGGHNNNTGTNYYLPPTTYLVGEYSRIS